MSRMTALRAPLNRLLCWAATAAVLALSAAPVLAAGTTHALIDALGRAFVRGLPPTWGAQRGEWHYFDLAECYATADSCYFNNPTSPYGYPNFGNTQPFSPVQMDPSEAIVLFLKTPPRMRYYGFTQYLMQRGPARDSVFASMSDSLDLLRITTLGSVSAGTNVFNQAAVLVWTADMNTLAGIQAVLAAQGIPASQVNFIPLPLGLPLVMGTDPAADSFSLVMRTALPNSQSDYDAYRLDSPFYAVRVTPSSPPATLPAPTVGYASDVSGVPEDAALSSALDALVTDIRNHYRPGYTLQGQAIQFQTRTGLDCIATGQPCYGDTHDALYSRDMQQPLTVTSLQDLVIVAGVNHQKTGKALYVSHTITDPVKSTGLFALTDPQFTTQSALYHAGVTSPRDPRAKQYKNLYAYAVSYDCGTLQYCQTIPAPTDANPFGLNPGAPFILFGRSYVDPHTGVRPNADEVVHHKVLIATKR